ncbi:MAG: hypothetical protein HRU11_02600 [Parvularculaceae bacterium]|nr:hypothetical protein [Parvularculaceae bacterium]
MRTTMLRKSVLAMAGVITLSGCAAGSGPMGEMMASAMGIPVVDAFLEDKQMVPMTASQPIDGIWMIDNIQKRVRFESGRAYAVEGWLHALSLKVQPNMVVVKDVVQTRAGEWQGQDLPLMGKAVYTLQANGKMVGVVTGMTGRQTLVLTPMAMDSPAAFASAMQEAGHSPTAVRVAQALPPESSYRPPAYQPPAPVQQPPVNPTPAPTPTPVEEEPETPSSSDECVTVGFDADGNPICA